MTFKEALKEACKELKLEQDFKEINTEEDAIATTEKMMLKWSCRRDKLPLIAKTTTLFTNNELEFCFFSNGNEVNFTMRGFIVGRNRKKVNQVMSRAFDLCELTQEKLRRQ